MSKYNRDRMRKNENSPIMPKNDADNPRHAPATTTNNKSLLFLN
jgi:hypothetical protein